MPVDLLYRLWGQLKDNDLSGFGQDVLWHPDHDLLEDDGGYCEMWFFL